jgi:hypothetical protein
MDVRGWRGHKLGFFYLAKVHTAQGDVEWLKEGIAVYGLGSVLESAG